MGEVERIRASLGASFGADNVHRVANLPDRQPKKDQGDRPGTYKEDALELHEEPDSPSEVVQIHDLAQVDHLDLSA